MPGSTARGLGVSPFGSSVISYAAKTSIGRNGIGLTRHSALETGRVLVGDQVRIAIELQANC